MTITAFEQLEHRHIAALKLDFHSYVHRETGARHFHFDSNDTNNAFMVAFPTLPTDSTGVAHMLEHTTLCGSRRYPVRDPFFMMLRRSLNTFMNAFTSADSTAYPFATQNRKDFSNLLGVYIDAVFFPNLDPLDFAQEGWRVDFESSEGDAKLVYKGVVYNEMKGAMSAPSSQLWQQLHSAIFSDTVYRHNSGGEPANIPDLSYDQLCAFHTKHYHPSHAVFMTYGNFPVDEHQQQFESLVLNRFTRSPDALCSEVQPRFDSPVTVVNRYAVTDEADLERGTHAIWAWLLGPSADPQTLLEGHLLAGLLLDHGASPLRHYLETTTLADAPSELCGLDDSARELVFCCGVEGTDTTHIEQLNDEILALLETVAARGIDHQVLEGIVDNMEMAQRDIGGGGYPYGLQLMGRVLPGALYGTDPADLIDIDKVLILLRQRIEEPDYVPNLIRSQLINNSHRVRIVMRPDMLKLERDNAAERARLDALLAHKTAGERAEVRSESAQLAARQDEPQNADLLPKVTLDDVPRSLPAIEGHTSAVGKSIAHHYAAATNGLCYFQFIVDLPRLNGDELMQLPLFCEYLTELGTGSEDYLATQTRRALAGNFGAHASVRASIDDIEILHGRLVVTAKGLAPKHNDLINNLFQVLEGVRFDESSRIQDLLAQSRLDLESSITDRGHQLAMNGAARSLSVGGLLDDLWEGPANISFVQALDRGCQSDPAKLAALANSFDQIRYKILGAPSQMLVVGEQDVVADALSLLQKTKFGSGTDNHMAPFMVPRDLAKSNCAWITNTQVNFCAKAYLAVTEGHADAPALAVLAKYLQDGYLHPAIREKGGAYGAGAQFDTESATFRFFSYRDPRLGATLEDFDRSLVWLEQAAEADRLEESILGVIRNLDSPRSPAGSAVHSFYEELDGRTHQFRLAYREAVLNTTFDDLRRVADRYLKPDTAAIAVITHAAHQQELEKLHLKGVKL